MHELSIVSSIVDSVTEALASYPGAKVKEVRLRVGTLASVIEDSLQFCYGIATDDTPLQGSKLVVKVLPVVARCDRCNADVEIASLQSFRCPRCDEPVSDLRQGRELEIESIEIEECSDITYLRCEWKHGNSSEPVLLYSELDGERWEIRKIEIWADGHCGYASRDTAHGGTSLGLVEVPALEEIAKDPDFEPQAISRDEFETVWAARIGPIALMRGANNAYEVKP